MSEIFNGRWDGWSDVVLILAATIAIRILTSALGRWLQRCRAKKADDRFPEVLLSTKGRVRVSRYADGSYVTEVWPDSETGFFEHLVFGGRWSPFHDDDGHRMRADDPRLRR